MDLVKNESKIFTKPAAKTIFLAHNEPNPKINRINQVKRDVSAVGAAFPVQLSFLPKNPETAAAKFTSEKKTVKIATQRSVAAMLQYDCTEVWQQRAQTT